MKQPVKPHELPEGPWLNVEMDFQGPYPNGEYVFGMIDRYSRWPECKIMKRSHYPGMAQGKWNGGKIQQKYERSCPGWLPEG